MENSVHSMHGAEVPCLLDTSSEIDRNDLMIDIMRLPMMQFQALCCGIRNNMSPDELAKMVSSWTEERVRKNILQTMAELEGRTNILSSSYHDRMLHKDNQEKRMEMTKDAPEVQLAPVTKEVFVTVLDSIKSPSSTEITSGSKQQFITYVHGMVDKVKDFPKLFKASHKQSKELNITPAVCESLSELLALPDPEKRSTTSLHDSTERLCTEDEISRASRGVSSILLTPGGSSSQLQVVTEIQQPQSRATSLASARSVHDNARGIVDTIVTDLEDLYESLEPKEVQMIQSQSSLTQIEHAMDDDETQKKFHKKVVQIMCSAQVKLRMFFTMHRSEDIIPDLKTDLATEETDHDGIQPENSCEGPNQSDAEGQADVTPHEDLILSFADEQMHATVECTSVSDGSNLSELTNESQVQALTSTEQQATTEMLDLEACDKSFPCKKDGDVPVPASQHEPKDKKPRTGKGLKIFFPKNIFKIPKMTPDDATEPQVLVNTSIPETVLYTTESTLETMSTFPIASPETATVEVIQHYVTPSQAAPQCMDICEDNETTLASSDQDEGIEAPIITESSDRQDSTLILEVVAVSDDKTSEPVEPMEQGEKFNLFSDRADTKPTSDSTDFDNTVAFIERSLSPKSFTKEDPDEMTDVVSSGNQHTMGGKFRRLFSKRPAVKTPEPQETTQDKLSSLEEKAVETHAPDMESFTCKPFESTLPEVSPSDDIGEGDGTSITDMTQDMELSLTPTTPEAKGNCQSVGRRFKTLFTRSPKPIDVEPPTQADEAVLAPILGSEMTDDTPDDSHALDTEATLQPPMTTSFKTSLQDVAVTPETKYNHLSVGKKIKTLFSKSPKPIDVEPVMQTDEAIAELPLSLDFEMRDQTSVDSCASDAEATLEPPTQTSDETSLQHAPAKVIPGSKDNLFSVGKKMKTLFTKSPKPIDAEPSIQGDEAVPEIAPSTDSEMKDESALDSSAPDAEATLQPPMQTSDKTSLHAPAKAIPECKDNRFSLGNKMKTLFTKSPKPIDVGPPLQTNEAISGIALSPDSEITVETHDTKATIQQEFLTTPSEKMETIIESTECSHAVLKTVVETSQSPEMGQSQEMAQGSPVFESSTSLTATEHGKVDGSSRSLSTKLKQLFFKHPKNTHDVPAVPAVSQEVAKECANDNISPETVSQTCEAPVQQSVNMSFQEMPRCEDIFETNGTVSPPVSQKGPTPNMTGAISKSVHFSFGERLKQFFLHPKHLEGRPEASTVSTELSSESALPERFHTISEATVALKNLTDRMVLHLDDTDTARAKLELLISCGVLRPFTDDLVNRVYSFLSGGVSGTAAGIELSRYASEPAIQTARTVGECKRELVVERDSEIIQAFAVKSIKALLRQLLEMLLPLLKDVDTSGCQVLDTVTDIMAMEVASTISLDRLMRRADTDVSDTDDYSESSMDFEAARSTATDDRTTISGGENGCPYPE